MRSTELRISHDAIVSNYEAIRNAVPDNIKICCVVKADAYGHGACVTAKRLIDAGADMLAVAIIEEALILRDSGIAADIIVLGGVADADIPEAIANKLQPAIFTPKTLKLMQAEAVRLGENVSAQLKIDTGMARIGVSGALELENMLDAWDDCPNVIMSGMFTHFAAADSDPEYTKEQHEAFMLTAARVKARGHSPILHEAATSAVMHSEYQLDMVRPGLGLYGFGIPELALTPAQTLITKPVRIERISKGDTVSYGRTFRAERDSLIITLPIGYGDGYPRILSNRAPILVNGVRIKQVGRVCMDMIMADATDVPNITLDTEYVLLGESITAEELAALAETIPYEIMLGFSARVRRAYM